MCLEAGKNVTSPSSPTPPKREDSRSSLRRLGQNGGPPESSYQWGEHQRRDEAKARWSEVK
eukprot:9476111-Pyramimonas_sp.AAC.1